MQNWAKAYQQATGVPVNTAGGGSTAGIDDASSGKVEVGASDAYLSSGDVLKNPSLLNIPLAISAQSVIYNVPGVSQSEHIQLTGTILADMYSGTVKTWNDPMIKALNGKHQAAVHAGRPVPPFPQGLGGHVPLHELPVDAGRGLE